MPLRVFFLLLCALLAMPPDASAQEPPKDRCRLTETGGFECDPEDREKLGPDAQDRDFFSGAQPGGALRPARLFAGPGMYPPENYRGYGILAFPSRATSYDRERHEMICAAYIASLPESSTLETPTEDQFVTIWPVKSDAEARAVTSLPLDEACPAAIDAYSQEAALRAIAAATEAGFRDDGLGPYLLAWSPPSGIGRSDVFVLALDLSNVRSYQQALALMTEWNRDIETDFDILANGFTLERLRVKIRRWADSYGDGFLKLLEAG
ncbi:hypothetical protein [Poseidonocella sp. HB161398]|uniref:hypothetical protein n=1 Tax=Poseidonocella sp. HB161398 TaxID=2320855 RepID=UPI001109A013|nr:hypothetical protein [Poseidonocella sp. HB161398]